jgi:PKD repeat protein
VYKPGWEGVSFKKKAALMLLLAFLVLAFTIVLTRRVHSATTWNVPIGPNAQPTISDAINNASAGDTILVHAGTYNETLDINKSLTIIGDDAATTIINGTGLPPQATGLVTITAAGDVLFKGFTVENALSSSKGNSGMNNRFEIYASGAASGATYTISYCNLYGTNNASEQEDYGFYNYNDSANVVFTHNMITQTGANAILVEVSTGATEISYNTLDAGCYGSDSIFFMAYGNPPLIVSTLQNVSYNTFDMGTGGPFDYSHRATGVSFNAPGAAYGVGDGGFTNMVISSNTFNNLQANRRAIGFWNNNNSANNLVSPQITGNVINCLNATDSYGIDFYGYTTGATVSENTINGTDVGIFLRNGDAPGTTIHFNNIAGNVEGVNWTLGSASVDATNNWWGSISGPNATSNPSGTGDPVSDKVSFIPWLNESYAPTKSLIVVSAYGTPSPSSGTFPFGTNITESVSSPVAGPAGTQYVCTGWVNGSGSVPANGTGTTVTFAMYQNSSITWNWTTQYLLTIETEGLPSSSYPTNVYLDGVQVGTAYDGSPLTEWFNASSPTGTIGVSGTVSGATGYQCVFTEWNEDSSTNNPRPSVAMNAPTNFTANYKTQYGVTFDQLGVGVDFNGTVVTIDSTDYGLTGLSVHFWWDNASTHTFVYQSPLVVQANVSRYCWNSTGGLSSARSGSLTISGPGSVIGVYNVQYYYTFGQTGVGSDFNGTVLVVDGTSYGVGSLPVSLWSHGSSFAFQSPLVVTANGKQYAWTSTTMASFVDIVGNYKTQYYLNLTTSPPGVAIPTGTGWYDAGTRANVSTPEYGVGGSRYLFTSWATANMSEIANPTANSTTVLVDQAKTVTANYVHQRLVTFAQTGLAADANGTVVTVNGTTSVYTDLPSSVWVDDGSAINYSYAATVNSTLAGKRFYLDNVTGSSSPITVTADTNVSGNYKTQYYLNVSSPYGTTGGQGWYNNGATTRATLDKGLIDQGNGTHQVFTNWSGDASGTNYTQSNLILMSGSKTAVADWKTQYAATFDQSGLNATASGTVLTINSTTVTFSQLPYTLYVDNGSSVAYSYSNVSTPTPGVTFNLTSIEGPSSPIMVTSSVTVIGNYTLVTAPAPPLAVFVYSPSEPYVNMTVIFDASASTPGYNASIAKYGWDFGDGSPKVSNTTPIAAHLYILSNNYTVTLNVTDSQGLWSTTSETVEVAPPEPQANFTWYPVPPKANQTVTFDATSSKPGWNGTAHPPIVNYTWDFGDGNVTSGNYPTIVHMYTAIGNYTVTLTVVDDNELEGSIAKTVAVQTNVLIGDLNGDGIVNILDAIVFANSFGKNRGDPGFNPAADMNGDGTVNVLDAIIMANHFGQHL